MVDVVKALASRHEQHPLALLILCVTCTIVRIILHKELEQYLQVQMILVNFCKIKCALRHGLKLHKSYRDTMLPSGRLYKKKVG